MKCGDLLPNRHGPTSHTLFLWMKYVEKCLDQIIGVALEEVGVEE